MECLQSLDICSTKKRSSGIITTELKNSGNSGINVFLNPSILSIYNDKALCIGFEEFKYTFIQKA